MPTPRAIIFARNALADDPGELDEDWLADQLDRFAAQRGAEVEQGGCFKMLEESIAAYDDRPSDGAPPQTGGRDAPHPIDGWTPEIMAEEARRFDEGLPAALDQFEKATGGGDAPLVMPEMEPACVITIELHANEIVCATEIYESIEGLLSQMGGIGLLNMTRAATIPGKTDAG